MTNRNKIITRTYIGNKSNALGRYQKDAVSLAAKGYFPTSQIYTPGTWSFGEFFLALLLCFLLIGILVFIYMIIVKPNGTLTVTYELREAQKACPRCAEMVMPAALVCRFCGFEFPPVPDEATTSPPPSGDKPTEILSEPWHRLIAGFALAAAIFVAMLWYLQNPRPQSAVEAPAASVAPKAEFTPVTTETMPIGVTVRGMKYGPR